MERTFGFLKPSIIRNKQLGLALHDIEKNFNIVAMEMFTFSDELVEEFYAEHAKKPFFKDIVKYTTAGPVVVFVLEGENVIKNFRDFIGATDPKLADPKTLRGKYGISIDENGIHGSDSKESAERELSLIFEMDDE